MTVGPECMVDSMVELIKWLNGLQEHGLKEHRLYTQCDSSRSKLETSCHYGVEFPSVKENQRPIDAEYVDVLC